MSKEIELNTFPLRMKSMRDSRWHKREADGDRDGCTRRRGHSRRKEGACPGMESIPSLTKGHRIGGSTSLGDPLGLRHLASLGKETSSKTKRKLARVEKYG